MAREADNVIPHLVNSNTRYRSAPNAAIFRTNLLRSIPDRSILDLGPHRAQRGRNWLASSKKRQLRLSAKAQEAVSRTSDQDTSALECATRGNRRSAAQSPQHQPVKHARHLRPVRYRLATTATRTRLSPSHRNTGHYRVRRVWRNASRAEQDLEGGI